MPLGKIALGPTRGGRGRERAGDDPHQALGDCGIGHVLGGRAGHRQSQFGGLRAEREAQPDTRASNLPRRPVQRHDRLRKDRRADFITSEVGLADSASGMLFFARALPALKSIHERAPPARARPPVGDAHLRRALRRPALQRALPRNLAKGQTGLSVAFDLPTQTGYDPDHVLARGEVGKVGVSIVHKGDMHALLDGIPLDEMNTSMTINATAAWLLASTSRSPRRTASSATALAGTTQNDIIKEYLSRGTYAFPPGPSMRLIADTVAFTVNEIPKWNPINVCSYHLQEAGATPVQEIAYALSTAIAVLDEVKARGQVADAYFPQASSAASPSSSTPASASSRSTRSCARWRALGGARARALRRHRAEVPAHPLRRPGQLPRPDRVPAREQRAADRARGARRDDGPRRPRPRDPASRLERGARPAPPLGPAVEPADPADPRLETDLLEYPDIFEGSR